MHFLTRTKSLAAIAAMVASAISTASAATTIVSGILTPNLAVGGRGPGSGTFHLRLVEDTLTYTVYTTRLGDAFVVPDAEIVFELSSGDLSVGFSSHGAIATSGCYYFVVGSPLSWRYEGSGIIGIPLDYPSDVQCDAIEVISILSETLQLTC